MPTRSRERSTIRSRPSASESRAGSARFEPVSRGNGRSERNRAPHARSENAHGKELSMKRTLMVAAVVTAYLAVPAGAALASAQQTNGQGLTSSGNTLGFNAKADLRGHLTYVTHDGSGLKIKCNGYDSYRFAMTAARFPRTRVTATCLDQNGTTVYMKVYFIDKGEPGFADKVLFYASYDAAFRHNAELDPNALVDTGIISNGNVQIHF